MAAVVQIVCNHHGSDEGGDGNREGVPAEHLELPAFRELCKPQSDSLVLSDLESLCEVVGKNDDATINLAKFKTWLTAALSESIKNSPDHINNLFKQFDGQNLEETNVTVEELHMALKAKRKTMMIDMKSKALKKLNYVSRQHMAQTIRNYNDRNDAFVTLPITLVYIIIFYFMVVSHLRINDRSISEKALEEWINGRDPTSDAENNVDNMASYWDWVLGEQDGIFGVLGDSRNSSIGWQYFLCSRHILVGDIHMKYSKFDGSEAESWLINSDVGQQSLQAQPNDFLAAATNAATDLKDNKGWNDNQIEKIWFSFSTYDEESQMFSLTEVYTFFKETGQVIVKINSESLSVQAYPPSDPLLPMWDAMFGILVIYLFFTEMKDICASIRMGFSEFLDYWKFWNCIDWVCIIMGMLIGAIWGVCMSLMQDSTFQDLRGDDGKLKIDVMGLSHSKVVDFTKMLWYLRSFMWTLHWAMALNTVSIVTKFFKAFTSNPKLQVVTDTFNSAFEEFVHFFIIFGTLFLPFVIIGHILFGNDISEFSSMFSSVNTGLMALFGEFGFYADATSSATSSAVLPSGMPIVILFVWYVLYMFIVLLVLLNMLLAIIIEHYQKVTERVKREPDAKPLWTQVHEFWNYKKDTRKFMSLVHIGRCLDDDDEPAHEQDTVSASSLKDAFQGMADVQADWLMNFLEKAKERYNGVIDESPDQLQNLTDLVEQSSERLEDIGGLLHQATEVSKGTQVGELSTMIKDLTASVSKVSQTQNRIWRKLDQVYASVVYEEGGEEYDDPKDKKAKKDKKEKKDKKDKKDGK